MVIYKFVLRHMLGVWWQVVSGTFLTLEVAKCQFGLVYILDWYIYLLVWLVSADIFLLVHVLTYVSFLISFRVWPCLGQLSTFFSISLLNVIRESKMKIWILFIFSQRFYFLTMLQILSFYKFLNFSLPKRTSLSNFESHKFSCTSSIKEIVGKILAPYILNIYVFLCF